MSRDLSPYLDVESVRQDWQRLCDEQQKALPDKDADGNDVDKSKYSPHRDKLVSLINRAFYPSASQILLDEVKADVISQIADGLS